MKKTLHDWRADAMAEEQIHAAALADPDAEPLTPKRLAAMRPTPQVRVIRRALGLSQKEFATRFSHSAWHFAGLGAGAQRSQHCRAGLSTCHRA